jgi:hypothetical protein
MGPFATTSVGRIAAQQEGVAIERRTPLRIPVVARPFVFWLAAAAVCCLALRFVFPGYFDPLSPFHIDNYISAGMHAEGQGLARYILHYPRPVAYMLLDICGRLGPRGQFVPLYALTWLNATLVVLYLERVTNSRVTFLGFLLFAALAYSNPEFYWNLKDDPFATFSLAFLLSMFHAWESYCESGNKLYLAAMVALAVVFSLTKESYFIALGVFLMIQAYLRPRHRTAALGLIAACAVFMGVDVYRSSQVWTLFHGSPDPGNAYYTSLRPGSVWHGFLKIGKYVATPLVGAAVVAAVIRAARTDRLLFGVCFAAVLLGAVSLLPNATLPNHLEPLYSFLGAYFFLSPLLFIDRLAPPRWRVLVAAVVYAIALISYHHPVHDVSEWLREQEQIARRILPALERVRSETAEGDRCLVAGATMFYDPFLSPEFILSEFGPSRFWTVVAPEVVSEDRRYTTEFIGPRNPALLGHYDHLFVFTSDGRLQVSVRDPSPAVIRQQLSQVLERR